MRITTWNVNSIRSRLEPVLHWLGSAKPDVLLLQEIKCEEHQFPALRFSELGYKSAVSGQKSYNGVAILHRQDVTINHRKLPGMGEADSHARYIEAACGGLTVGNLYLPNGNSNGDAGYALKLRFMDALHAHATALLATDTPLILAGDYNVCPEDIDCAPGVLGADDALLRPATRERYWKMIWSGLTDAIRAITPAGPVYTFWDYQAGCWARDRGLRIDHALLSPTVAERLLSATPQKHERGEDQPSDHVPVMLEFA